MADQHEGEWHYLEAEVDGVLQHYQLDTSKLSGGEAELIEDRTGISLRAWGYRVRVGPWAKDLNLLLFMAASRAQIRQFGTSELDYRAFIDRVELTSVRQLDGPPDPPDDADDTPKPAPRRSSAKASTKT